VIKEVAARSIQGRFDVKATPPKTHGLARLFSIRPSRLARILLVGAALASAFGVAIFVATPALGQDQTPSTQRPADAETTRSVRVGEDLARENLVYQVAPVYPSIAKTAHVSGTVLLHCIIGLDGTVEDLQYVSGPPLLMKSAMDAVRQWRYKPTLIDGKEVQVDTRVSVVFTLDGSPSSDAPQQIDQDAVDQYESHGYVNDFAGIIESDARSQLDLICKELDKDKKTQMAIVTVVSLDGVPIKEFATQLANRWGVGHRDTDRGVLVLLSRTDRQYRIAVGLGLESVLTDEEADRLGKEMLPMLRTGDYGGALLHLAKSIQTEIQQNEK
jgi:TonB family protein